MAEPSPVACPRPPGPGTEAGPQLQAQELQHLSHKIGLIFFSKIVKSTATGPSKGHRHGTSLEWDVLVMDPPTPG